MTMLADLEIEQAKGGVIYLKDVPNGATALIPEFLNADPENRISIFISGVLVVDDARLGDLVGKFYQHNIEKEYLLDLSGPDKDFYYIIYFGGNEERSRIVKYSIVH